MLVIVKYYSCLQYFEATGDSLFDYDCPWLFQLTVTGNRKQYPQFHRLITADNITADQLILSCLALENSCSMFISCWVYDSRPWRQPNIKMARFRVRSKTNNNKKVKFNFEIVSCSYAVATVILLYRSVLAATTRHDITTSTDDGKRIKSLLRTHVIRGTTNNILLIYCSLFWLQDFNFTVAFDS